MRRLLALLALIGLSAVTVLAPDTLFCPNRPEIMRKIAVMEGFPVPGSLPARYHNPGDLVYVGQPGAKLGKRQGLAVFESDALGWIALEQDLIKKRFNRKKMAKAWPWMRPK